MDLDMLPPPPIVRRSIPMNIERAKRFVREHRAMFNSLALVDGPQETMQLGTRVYQLMKVGRKKEAAQLLQEAEANPPFTHPRSLAWLKEMRLIHAPYGLVHPASREGRARRALRQEETAFARTRFPR